MKKTIGMSMALVAVALMLTLSACGNSNNDNAEPGASSPSAEASVPAVEPSPSAQPSPEASNAEPRIVKEYLNMTFDDVEDGADVPNVAAEGAGFKVVKADGNGWAVSKNTQDWAAMFLGVADESGTEIFLENFAIETKMMLPADNDGLSNDGGIPLFVAAEGRYDAAIGYGADLSFVNVWKAGNTDGGPIMTNNKAEFPERGWVSDFKLDPGKEYVYTIIGTHRKDADENEFVHLRIYVDKQLVADSEVPFWKGGFGLRAWQSAIRYDYLKITDAPLTAPDGTSIEVQE